MESLSWRCYRVAMREKSGLGARGKLRPNWGILGGLLLLLMCVPIIHFYLYDAQSTASLRKLVWHWPFLRVLVLDDILTALVLFIVVLVTRRARKMTLGQAFGWYGMTGVDFRQVLVALFSTIPLLAVIGWSKALGGDVHINSEPCTRVHFLLLNVVLYEEVIFRGFFFRNLRARYPFWRACIITALAGVLFHVPGAVRTVLHGAPPGSELLWLIQIMAYGISQSYLYERGSYSLWGCILLHFAADWGVYVTVGLPVNSITVANALGAAIPYALIIAPFVIYPVFDAFRGRRRRA